MSSAEIRIYDTEDRSIGTDSVDRSDLSASPDDGLSTDFTQPDVSRSADGTLLLFDFDGNGRIDDEDIREVSFRWNTCEGEPD